MAFLQSPRAAEREGAISRAHQGHTYFRDYRLLAVSTLKTGHRCNEHDTTEDLSCVTLSLCFVLQTSRCRVQRSVRIECLARQPAERPSYARGASAPLSSHTSLTHPSRRPYGLRAGEQVNDSRGDQLQSRPRSAVPTQPT